ncbi:MAG: hypothetical protein GTO08_01955, partial [Deltaproteobacteria bacterium]|nr:hypothetical protein [Deltaproteobacteria bacterium]
LQNNSALPDEEFLQRCYRIFFDRKPEGEDFEKLLQLLKQGVAKETVFMTRILQHAEFREHNTRDSRERRKEPVQRQRTAEDLLKELDLKEKTVRKLQRQLKERLEYLEQIRTSTT